MKKALKIICIILLAIVILGIIFFTIDYNRVKKQEKPIFCIKNPRGQMSDGGTVEYIGLGYKVIDFHTLAGFDDIKIGTWFMKYDDFDEEMEVYEEKINEQFLSENANFTKTYYILSDLGVTDQTGEYNYYTIGQYQIGEPIVVKINSKYKLKENMNYEFSFEGIETSNEKYSIQEIFDTFTIVDIKLTDKLGMEQVQDKFTNEKEDPRLIKNVEAKDIRYEKEIDSNIKIRAIYRGSILGQKEVIIIGKTTDGGKTWYNQAEMYDGENVNIGAKFVFLDEDIGFINNLQTVVNNDTQRGLLVTIDGGKNFTTAKFIAPEDIGGNYLYVDGVPYIENGILKVKTYSTDYNRDPATEYYEFYTEDKGITWKYIK